jgi:serine/alanine adding enzyme
MLDILRSNDPRWYETLQRTGMPDVYLTPEYAAPFDFVSEGQSEAFVYEDSGEVFLFPYRRRAIPVPGFEGLSDMTSEYGYGGPASSTNDPEFLRLAYAGMDEVARERRIVTEFCRYHSLLGNHAIGQIGRNPIYVGETVCVNTAVPFDEILADASKNARRDYRRGLRMGVSVRVGSSDRDIEQFVDVYTKSMKRAQASAFYYFPGEFFQRAFQALPSRSILLMAEFEGRVLSAAMFLYDCAALHYHFSGTDREDPASGKTCAAVVVLFEALRFAQENGIGRVHLGGGVGSQADALFRFKARFSSLRRQFHVSKHVFDPGVYAEICTAARVDPDTDYFPAYRAAEN